MTDSFKDETYQTACRLVNDLFRLLYTRGVPVVQVGIGGSPDTEGGIWLQVEVISADNCHRIPKEIEGMGVRWVLTGEIWQPNPKEEGPKVREMKIEVNEADLAQAVMAAVNRYARDRIGSHIPYLQGEADEKIRGLAKEVLLGVDIRGLVERAVHDSLASVLENTVRSQVRSVVRLAVHQELAALKAEFQEGKEQDADHHG